MTPEDSHVTWVAAEGEAPVLTGAVAVTGWTPRKLGALPVWAIDTRGLLPPGRTPRALFVNGERRSRARLPKSGYWRIESVPGRALGGDHWKTLFEGSDAFVAAPGTVAPWTAFDDAEAVRLPLLDRGAPAARLLRPGDAPRANRPQEPDGARRRGGRRLSAVLRREREGGPRARRVVPRPREGRAALRAAPRRAARSNGGRAAGARHAAADRGLAGAPRRGRPLRGRGLRALGRARGRAGAPGRRQRARGARAAPRAAASPSKARACAGSAATRSRSARAAAT